MQQFVSSVRMSMATGNWFGGLFMALALPDICGALEDGVTSGARYKDWYSRYLNPIYNPEPLVTKEDLIQLKIRLFNIQPSFVENFSQGEAAKPESEILDEIASLNSSHALTAFSADDRYKFRCKSLHQGISEGSSGRIIEFSPPVYSSIVSIHKCIIAGKYILDISMFCEDMCNAVEKWLADKASDLVIQQRISELMTLDSSLVGPSFPGFTGI